LESILAEPSALLPWEQKKKMKSLLRRNRFLLQVKRQAPEGVLKRLEQESRHLAEKGGTVSGIGISCGGPLDSKRGLILSPPNLPGWDNIPITEYFSSRFHVPVFLQNDANACALAEWRYGAGKGLDDMVFLTFGTGIGAGLILNGKLYEGKQSMAGEAGHWRMASFGPIGYGKAGSFEGFCSGGGIAQLARQKILEQLQMGKKHPLAEKLENISAKDVSRFAWGGRSALHGRVQNCRRIFWKRSGNAD
jgi:glucokinase